MKKLKVLQNDEPSQKTYPKRCRDTMPDPRRSIEIELQWLVSVYSPKVLGEIQSLLNVILFQKKYLIKFLDRFRSLWN